MGSTKLQHDHYRALGIQVRNTTMCTSRNNPGPGQQNNYDEQFQWQSGLYPDLSGLFGGDGQEGQERQERQERQPAMMLLLRLLGISQEQLQPAPSAPPAEGEQGRHCHCHHHHHPRQPDLLPIILSKCCQFSMQITKHMVRVASPLVLLITIFLMARSIIYSAVFMMLSAGLGLHMPTLVAGQMLYALLSFTDPLLMTFICIFAVHKTVIRKKPLIDLNYWKRRIAGMENSRMN